MNVAIIPARGGSKRLPGKNIKNFFSKPIISYSIEAALSSKLFDQVVVTTDSEEIAEVAREYGATVPFMRPPELSDDSRPVILPRHHAQDIDTLEDWVQAEYMFKAIRLNE